MNTAVYCLIINKVTSHHPFIKVLTKREMVSAITFSFHQYNIFDDCLMSIYVAVVQPVYILIHHFIKISGYFQLSFRYRVKPACPPCR